MCHQNCFSSWPYLLLHRLKKIQEKKKQNKAKKEKEMEQRGIEGSCDLSCLVSCVLVVDVWCVKTYLFCISKWHNILNHFVVKIFSSLKFTPVVMKTMFSIVHSWNVAVLLYFCLHLKYFLHNIEESNMLFSYSWCSWTCPQYASRWSRWRLTFHLIILE